MAASKRNVPARTTRAVKPKDPPMFEAVTEIDADGNIDVKIFGEPFTISTDVNGWLLLLAGTGSPKALVDLVNSILVVPEIEGVSIEVARRREADRFNQLLGSRRNFSVESAIELVNALTEVSAGNEE